MGTENATDIALTDTDYCHSCGRNGNHLGYFVPIGSRYHQVPPEQNVECRWQTSIRSNFHARLTSRRWGNRHLPRPGSSVHPFPYPTPLISEAN